MDPEELILFLRGDTKDWLDRIETLTTRRVDQTMKGVTSPQRICVERGHGWFVFFNMDWVQFGFCDPTVGGQQKLKTF